MGYFSLSPIFKKFMHAGNFFYHLQFFFSKLTLKLTKKIGPGDNPGYNHQSVKQFGPRSVPVFCEDWSGSKLFAKVISRRHCFPASAVCRPLLHARIQRGHRVGGGGGAVPSLTPWKITSSVGLAMDLLKV